MQHSSVSRPLVFLSLSLGLLSCGGGSGGTGGTGGGSGSGGSGSGSVLPTSGEYVWETGDARFNLSYATINTTTGAIGTPTVAGSPAGNATGYPAIAIAPGNDFLYSFYDSFNEVESFEMSGPGLQLTGPISTQSVAYETSMTLAPSGKFLYIFKLGTGVIQVLSVNASTGALPIGPAITVSGGPDLRTGVIDSSGQFMYVNDLTGGRIFAFQINSSDGSLTQVSGSPYTLPGSALPQMEVIAGSGKLLYVDISSGQPEEAAGIDAYSIGNTNGALTLVSGSPFPTAQAEGSWMCTDPAGAFVYLADFPTGEIEAFSADATTGALSPVQGSPFNGPTDAGNVVVDPSGKYLYVTDYESSSIYGFSRNPTTGALTALSGSPFPSVPQPVALTMMNVP
jgi:6-phosphogluconolactonase